MRCSQRLLLIFGMLLGLGIVLGGCDSGSAPTSAPAQNTSVPPAQPTATGRAGARGQLKPATTRTQVLQVTRGYHDCTSDWGV